MRRLLPLIILASACAGTPKGNSNGALDIDVLWEEPLQAPSPTESTSFAKQVSSNQDPALYTNSYHLTWQGQRIGEAREIFHRSSEGVRVIRHEEIRITRSGVPVDIETEIIIHADANLLATRVELKASAGAVTREGHALRADDGRWVIALDGEPVRKAPASAVPLELVPYLVAQTGKKNFKSKVLLAGFGFAVTDMKLSQNGRNGKAILMTQWGKIETQLQMAGDGALLRTATGSTGSIRVDETRLTEQFERPELPESSSIPLRGDGLELLVEHTQRPPPPALEGQSVSLRKNGWRVQFRSEPVAVSRRVSRLTHQVDSLLSDAHDAPGAGGNDALTLGRGDCTAHSTLFVDMAREQGIEAKLVTGYRVDGNKLVRHRWVTVRQGKSWIQVDPTFGESPVKPRSHLALAVHGDSTAQIALVDEAVFQGFSNAKARWVNSRVASARPQ